MTGLFSALADRLDPPPPAPDLATPAAFATAHSRGQWVPARHLELIEDAVLHAIDTGGNVILSVSVRHGKSQYASKWLPAWYLGTHPDERVILAAHEADFAARWGRAARDILTEHGHRFGVSVAQASKAANRWDIQDREGGMLTVGVGGSPIGRGAKLLIVDDPIKSWQDAMSPLVRRRVVEWWTGTMESRRQPGGAVVLICARWHTDDLTGVLLRDDPDNWTEVRLPAICDDPDSDPLGRVDGEALWPEGGWTVDELEKRRRSVTLALGDRVWQAQYQQRPMPATGGMFAEQAWQFAPYAPELDVSWCRAWDLAATEAGGDYTAGALVGLHRPSGRVFVADIARGQWSPDQVRERLLACAAVDPPGCRVELPQDPGQAGKDQAQQLTRLLVGHNVGFRPVTGSKEVRAVGAAAQQAAGNVTLVEGPWNGAFVEEHSIFPRGGHDDQVDAFTTAFNWLVSSAGEVRATEWRHTQTRR